MSMTISDKQLMAYATRAGIMLAMVTAAWLCGCSNDECLENKNALPLAGFYSSTVKPTQISLDSISIYGIGAPGDSVLHDSVRSLSQSYLPFRIDEGTTRYVIRYLAGIPGILRMADTITFHYEIKPWFVSSACGASYRYEMKEIATTHYFIDSVTCPKGMIDNENAENLRIYFRVSESEN